MEQQTNQQQNTNQEQGLCPVHETPLEDGYCNLCAVCYSCEGKM